MFGGRGDHATRDSYADAIEILTVHIGSMYMSIQENIGSTSFRYGGVQFNIGICTVGNISYSLGTPTCHDLSSDLPKQLA